MNTFPKRCIGKWSWPDLEEDARLSALEKGLIVQRRNPDRPTGPVLYQPLPVTLFPSYVGKQTYRDAIHLQRPINLMMMKIGHDAQFVESVLGDLVKVDDFTGKLLEVNRTVLREGVASLFSLGIIRSDYMIDSTNMMKQVEVNAISVSFAGLAPRAREYHAHNLRKYMKFTDAEIDRKLPENSSCTDVVSALSSAWNAYHNPASAILMVVEEVVVNIMDQKAIEILFSEHCPAPMYRRTFRELDSCLTLGPNKELLLKVPGFMGVEQSMEISVVYYRTAYAPADFAYENAWSVRLLIERSRAIKCPSIPLQLAGVKKFQSVLCDKSILEKYVEGRALDKVYNTFANFWPANQTSLALVKERPSCFVLKPNREGGGNNYFKDDIVEQLGRIAGTELEDAYTVMEYIEQLPRQGLIVRPDLSLERQLAASGSLKTELGIFGTILTCTATGDVVVNEAAGHLLRAKSAESNETGIMAGAGAIDSPLLVDDQLLLQCHQQDSLY